MEKMNFNIVATGLKDYVNQVGTGEIVSALAGSAKSIADFAQQGGVIAPTDIHLMSVSGSFADGKNCTLGDSAVTFTDRQITPAFLKIESVFCNNDIYGKWLAYNSTYNNGNRLPFEAKMVESFQDNFGDKLEDYIWNGITLGSKNYKGIVNIVETDGTQVKTGVGANAYEQVVKLIKAIPAKQFKDTVIYVSEPKMIELKEELLKRDFRLIDLDFTNGAIEGENAIKMPVFGITVKAVTALGNSEKMYAVVPAHTVYAYGTDGGAGDFAVVYDDVNERTILRGKIAAGVQIAYPSETFYAENVN